MQIVKPIFVMIASCLAMGTAFASDADFVLKNKTGYQIDEVYISLPSSKARGNDIMGKNALGDGDAVKITFPHGNGACNFDIQVKYHDGDKAEWGNVDLCK